MRPRPGNRDRRRSGDADGRAAEPRHVACVVNIASLTARRTTDASFRVLNAVPISATPAVIAHGLSAMPPVQSPAHSRPMATATPCPRLILVFLLSLTAFSPLTAAEDGSGIVFDFGIGEPVPPPAKLDRKYTRTGLREAFTALCKRLGYSIVKLDIDQAEFPYLITAVIEDRCDYRALRDGLSSMSGYAYNGCATRYRNSVTHVALNMIPTDQYPADQSRVIQQRVRLRLSKLAGLPPPVQR